MTSELQIELEEILSELPIYVVAVNLQEAPDGTMFAGVNAIVSSDTWSSKAERGAA